MRQAYGSVIAAIYLAASGALANAPPREDQGFPCTVTGKVVAVSEVREDWRTSSSLRGYSNEPGQTPPPKEIHSTKIMLQVMETTINQNFVDYWTWSGVHSLVSAVSKPEAEKQAASMVSKYCGYFKPGIQTEAVSLCGKQALKLDETIALQVHMAGDTRCLSPVRAENKPRTP